MKIFLTIVALLSLAGCSLDFTEAVPCDSDAQCPTGMSCDLTLQTCMSGGGSGPLADTGGNNGQTNNGGTNNGPPPDTGLNNGPPPDVGGNNGETNNGQTNNGAPDMGPPDAGNNGAPDMPANNGGPDFQCPEGMAAVAGAGEVAAFCIDRWEASRPDATDQTPGTDSTRAVSQQGVRPWTQVDLAAASAACAGSGKRLCSLEEWQIGCGGPELQFYPYSNSQYEAGRCNNAGSVANTGSYDGCTNAVTQTFDMSGNVLEVVDTGDNSISAVGGSYQDTSSLLLACTNPARSLSPSPAMGFRCCQNAP